MLESQIKKIIEGLQRQQHRSDIKEVFSRLLCDAAKRGYFDIAIELIKSGAFVNYRNEYVSCILRSYKYSWVVD